VYAQSPFFFAEGRDVPLLNYPAPDSVALRSADETAADHGDPFRIGTGIPVKLNLMEEGASEERTDGILRTQLLIQIRGAQALALSFERFELPQGSVLTLSPGRIDGESRIYTADDNPLNTLLYATGMIAGDLLLISVERPENSPPPILIVSEIAYFYRGTESFISKGTQVSGSCEVNVNCSPEGDQWQDEKRGVARVQIKVGSQYFVCSGSLVNNTAQDCRPYFLMAEHCGPAVSAADLNLWVFYFDYEGLNCSSTSPMTTSHTITGAVKRASAPNNIGTRSDMLLLELNQSMPESWQAFYNGWNRSDTAASQGVGIHHPAGDIKKISRYTSPLTNFLGTHWEVHWVATTNGHGVTEGGSSGSPIFDASGRIVGTLTGGFSSCSNLTGADWYGKMWFHWDQNGSAATQQLKPWLDPLGTGVYRIDGSYCPQIQAGFSADTTDIPLGYTVHFTDTSMGSVLSRSWIFPGGNPSSSGVSQPAVTYDTAGVYDVSLSISGNGGSDQLTRPGYIRVYPPPQASFVSDTLRVQHGNAVHFSSTSTGDQLSYAWTFTGGSPASSSDSSISVVYNNVGIFPAGLSASSPWGPESTAPMQSVEVVDSLWGQVSYANAQSTIIPGIPVILEDSVIVRDSTQSNSGGYYGIPTSGDAGTRLRCVPDQNIDAGVINSVDALLIMKHFVGLQTLTGVHLQAADVDGSGVVNATDALQVAQFFTGLRPAFAAGPWQSELKIPQAGQAFQRIDLKVVATGDVNGSWVPLP
ncbi:MAG: hypothetical protein IH599_03225, partial [Bacteroidales bacterium]|nr:hypothetical protein [Bacteroidales bacterium]